MKTLILGGVCGGIILFVWNAFSWMVLPWHNATILSFGNEAEVAEAIRGNAPSPGVYYLPNKMHAKPEPGDLDASADYEQSKSIQEKGPLAFAAVRLQGSVSMGPQLFVSLLIQIASALIVTWLLTRTKGLSYGGKLAFVVTIALLISIFAYLPQWNWWGFSTGYTLVGLADALIGWLLAGLAIAKFT